MAVEFHCPHCGQLLSAPDEAAGTAGTCRFCGAAIVAPHSPLEAPRLLQPGEPAKAPYGTPSANQPTGYVDPGAVLTDSWRILVANWPLVLGAQWLALFVTMVAMAPMFVPIWTRSFEAGMARGPFPASAPPVSPGMYLLTMVVGVLIAPVQFGPLYVVDRLLARGQAGVGDMFLFVRHYGKLLQFAVLLQLPGMLINLALHPFTPATVPSPATALAGGAVGVVLSAFIYTVFYPGVMEVVDRGANGLDAMKAAWTFTQGHRWAIFASFLLLGIGYMAGVVLCCVGWIFTIGLLPVGLVVVYRNIRGLQGTVD